jgi:hypothetical protein
MKTAFAFAGAWLLVSATTLHAAPAQPPSTAPGIATPTKTPADPVLVALSNQLKRLLHSSQPLATVAWDTSGSDSALVAQYQTQPFLIYGRYQTGELAAKPDTEIGPNYQGFLLKLGMRTGKYTGQFVVPQELHGPYWTTYVNAVPIKGGNRYLWVSLSYGIQSNAVLLKQITQMVLAAGS